MSNEVIDIHLKVGAIVRNGHFVGTNGSHFDTYLNKDALYPHTAETSRICQMFAEKYKDENIEAVAAPALGGIIISQWTAHHLSDISGKEVYATFTEKTEDGGQIFTRGYDKFVRGRRVLIIEDNTTTGGSVMKVVNAVRSAGGEVAAVCVMINRDPEKVNSETLGIRFDALSELPVTSYSAEECPLCKSGVPINTELGKGKKYLENLNGRN